MRARVYWNLHKKCWSIKEGTAPVRHAKAVCLTDGSFLVQKSGRQRVLRERRKYVHAFACGTINPPPEDLDETSMVEVTYNPYRHETFVRRDNGESVHTAGVIVLTEDKRVLAKLD